MSQTDCDRISVTDPTDPRFLLLQNLRLIRTGIKSRAPGIRRCPDCDLQWIDDHTGLRYCPDCRTTSTGRCAQCRAVITLTEKGERLCESCTDQLNLF